MLQGKCVDYLDSVGAKVPPLYRVRDGPHKGDAIVQYIVPGTDGASLSLLRLVTCDRALQFGR